MLRRAAQLVLSVQILALAPPAWSHDLTLQLHELRRGTLEIGRTLRRLRDRPPIPRPPRGREEQRRVLGEAEIERALGNDEIALRKLLGRLSDPEFRKLPDYVPALLFASQILEDTDDLTGAMLLSRRALETGGAADQMAEAGARWFRLARRLEWFEDSAPMLELWGRQGGMKAAGIDQAAAAAYEAGFALRVYGRRAEAQALLATVPSDSAFGSRAAYLAGVLFVEAGDLESAEKWFATVMDWPLPLALDDTGPQRAVELEVRELAALSAGRLRYERGDLDGADEAYGRIGEGSVHLADACYERSFLALERKRRRGALVHLQCVFDLGARGDRYIDLRFNRASLLAHLARYSESVEAYEVLHANLSRERDLVRTALKSVTRPSEFLFGAMERGAVSGGRSPAPAPSTLFGDSWTAAVDDAYRLDREVLEASRAVAGMLAEIQRLRGMLDRIDVFPPLLNRRQVLQQIIREIQHLQGHSAELLATARGRQASLDDADHPHPHPGESAEASELVALLDRYSRDAEAQIVELVREEESRRAQAETTMAALETELKGLSAVALALGGEITEVGDRVSQEALDQLLARFEDAVMRAEAGVLDTFWIRKEHVSQQIREIGQAQEQLKESFEGALEATSD